MRSHSGARSKRVFVPLLSTGMGLSLAVFLTAVFLTSSAFSQSPPQFIRGDSNADGLLNVADPIYLLEFLFIGGPPPPCRDSADANDSGALDIADATAILGYLFVPGFVLGGLVGEPSDDLPSPSPDCGSDPTTDGLGCDLFPPCGTYPPPPGAPILNPYTTSTIIPTVSISGQALPNSTVKVVGFLTTQYFDASPGGTFTAASIPLHEDLINTIFFTAIDSYGTESAPSTAIVTHDTEAPQVYIDFPPPGAEVIVDSIDVAGRVGDTLSGFAGLTVTVNGIPAAVDVGIGTNGTFFASAVPLTSALPPVPTILTAVATDVLGNSATTQISVTRLSPTGPTITMVSGNGQTGQVGSLLLQPIVVFVQQIDGSPFANKLVTFHVTRSDGRVSGSVLDLGALSYQVLTNAAGQAMALWRLGTDAGCGNNRVAATSEGVAGTVYFCATATPGPVAQLNIGSGNNQKVETGFPTPLPLRVWASDSCNGVAGVQVTYTVIKGGGTIGGAASFVVETSDTGHAEVTYVLGDEVGLHLIEADFPGNPTGPAKFAITGVKRDPSQPTTFVGMVLNNAQQPIGGALVNLSVAGTFMPGAITDPTGRFMLGGITASGVGRLFVDGGPAMLTAGLPVPAGTYPSLVYDVVVIPNSENSLSTPVLLPKLDPRNWVSFDNTADVELTCAGIEGLVFKVFAGSMTRADGSVPSPTDPEQIGVHQVHHDDVPMPMPDGAAPPFAWTFQPGGADFDPPVQVTYPNMSGLAPGAIAYFLSFNHATGRFEIVCSGRVADDGASIVSDPGSGITHAGWGCNCPPYSVTGECENCSVTITGSMYACPGDECQFTAVGDPSGGTFSWSGGTPVGGTDGAAYGATFAAKGDQVVTVTYTCPSSPPSTSSASHTVKVEYPTKAVTFTKSRHPLLAAPSDYQALFNSGAAAMRMDDDGPGDGGETDDVCLDVTPTVNDAASATFPDQSAATFPAAERFDYTLAEYNDIVNLTVRNQLRAATFADLKLVTSSISAAGGMITGVANPSNRTIIFTQGAIATTTVHEWGHNCGLSHRDSDSEAIMYGTSSATKNEINRTERASYQAY
ncbi:MAG: hypothetical protein ACKVX7_18855 [Planctomycetota bacterium]